ncbi:hypothetical protein [Streptomyces sp. BBFR102]|uniref:hypothetical protein n=1 Tax=Streptomyces sp. BBFR102 TaxID=3448171 RepID=UPI003F536186
MNRGVPGAQDDRCQVRGEHADQLRVERRPDGGGAHQDGVQVGAASGRRRLGMLTGGGDRVGHAGGDGAVVGAGAVVIKDSLTAPW